MKDFILTSNRSVYNPLSRVNYKSLQMSSLDIKIVLLLRKSSRARLFLCFCSFPSIVCIFLMFLYSYYFILQFRLDYFSFSGGHRPSAIKISFQFPWAGQFLPYKTELKRMKTTYELYFYCTRSTSGAHNYWNQPCCSFINLSWADKSVTSMFIMFILVSALRNNSFIEFKLTKREEQFFARGSNKEKSFYPSRVCN